MFVVSIESGLFGEVCYVVGPTDGTGCVVVDPGLGCAEAVAQIAAEQIRVPEAVLLTHGHLDHIIEAREVCDRWRAPCYIAAADHHLLADPRASLGPELQEAVDQLLAERSLEPAQVIEYANTGSGDTVGAADLEFRVIPAPGHTPGSVLLRLDPTPELAVDRPVVFTGDVLFAGAIGRTDLPGGDHQAMLSTLRETVLGLPDEAVLLPGHGGQTTMAHERRTNSYLQDGYLNPSRPTDPKED